MVISDLKIERSATSDSVFLRATLGALDAIVAGASAKVVFDEMAKAIHESPEFKAAVVTKMKELFDQWGSEIVLRGIQSLLMEKK